MLLVDRKNPKETPQVCPRCHGEKLIQWQSPEKDAISSKTCTTCNGSGVVWRRIKKDGLYLKGV